MHSGRIVVCISEGKEWRTEHRGVRHVCRRGVSPATSVRPTLSPPSNRAQPESEPAQSRAKERERARLESNEGQVPSTIFQLDHLCNSTMASLAVPSILRSSARRAAQVSTVNRFRTRDLDGPVVQCRHSSEATRLRADIGPHDHRGVSWGMSV